VREVSHVFERQVAPSGVKIANPAFDVTPSELITAIITERGVARQPLGRTLARLATGTASVRASRAERKPERRREARKERRR
jgi:translation initiation factor 2B subunit (eIF-2B alpha/beta/delta family)